MTRRRFEWLLRTRGPALEAWAPADHAAALVLLRHDPCARRHLADTLAGEDEPAADRAVLARMQAVVRSALAPACPIVRRLRWSALAGAAFAGLLVGASWSLGAAEPSVAALGPTIEAPFPATVLAALEP